MELLDRLRLATHQKALTNDEAMLVWDLASTQLVVESIKPLKVLVNPGKAPTTPWQRVALGKFDLWALQQQAKPSRPPT